MKSFTIYKTETPEIELTPTKKTYKETEKIVINVHIKNPSSVLCYLWQMGKDDGSKAINTKLPKYAGTNTHVLNINDCEEKDMELGPYFLLAELVGGKEIRSNEISLRIVKGKHYTCNRNTMF